MVALYLMLRANKRKMRKGKQELILICFNWFTCTSTLMFMTSSSPSVATCHYTNPMDHLHRVEISTEAQTIPPCPISAKSLMNFGAMNGDCNPQKTHASESNTDNVNITMSFCFKELRSELCPSHPHPSMNDTCHLSDQLVCMAKLCHTLLELDEDADNSASFACHDDIIAIILQETDHVMKEIELIKDELFYQFYLCIGRIHDGYYCSDLLVSSCLYGSSISPVDCLEYLPSICQKLEGHSDQEECADELPQIFEDDVYNSCKKGRCVSLLHQLR